MNDLLKHLPAASLTNEDEGIWADVIERTARDTSLGQGLSDIFHVSGLADRRDTEIMCWAQYWRHNHPVMAAPMWCYGWNDSDWLNRVKIDCGGRVIHMKPLPAAQLTIEDLDIWARSLMEWSGHRTPGFVRLDAREADRRDAEMMLDNVRHHVSAVVQTQTGEWAYFVHGTVASGLCVLELLNHFLRSD
jgi:hypothetical protein